VLEFVCLYQFNTDTRKRQTAGAQAHTTAPRGERIFERLERSSLATTCLKAMAALTHDTTCETMVVQWRYDIGNTTLAWFTGCYLIRRCALLQYVHAVRRRGDLLSGEW